MFVFGLLHAFTAFGTFEAPAVLTAQRGEEFRVTERWTHVSSILNHTYELVVFGFYLLRGLKNDEEEDKQNEEDGNKLHFPLLIAYFGDVFGHCCF
jgi:hypothetical protein